MFALNTKVKQNIEKDTGLSVAQMSKMSAKNIDDHIEKRIGKKLHLRIQRNKHLCPRGSVYLFLRRLLPLKRADKKLSRI